MIKGMPKQRTRKLNTRLRKFFKCSDRALSIKWQFEKVFKSQVVNYQFQCLSTDQLNTDLLLERPVLAKTVKVNYDDARATEVIYLSKRYYLSNRKMMKKRAITVSRRLQRPVRRFHHKSKVIPVLLARIL